MKTRHLFLPSIILPLLFAATAQGGINDVLIDQLRQLERENAPPTTQPAADAARRPRPPLSDAEQAELQEILQQIYARRLLQPNRGNDGGLGEAIDMADTARARLQELLDPGHVTQTLQIQTLSMIDSAIEQARKNQSQSSSQSQGQGQQQDRGQGRQQQPQQGRQQGGQGQASMEDSTMTSGQAQTPVVEGDLREMRRSWNNLPQKDREEVVQGSDEQGLQIHRDLIKRYYELLAEQ